jgi:hypothetical protein
MNDCTRRIFNRLVALSLFLLLASSVFWILSIFRADILTISIDGRSSWVLAQAGSELLFGYSGRDIHGSPSFQHDVTSNDGIGVIIWACIIGDRQSTGWGSDKFGYVELAGAMPGEQINWAFWWPYWVVIAVTSVLPAVWLFGWWKRRKPRALEHCANCGYDLRATPDRCPECGAIPSKMGTVSG